MRFSHNHPHPGGSTQWIGSAQVWVSRDGKPPSEDSLVTPSEPPINWERYALKPKSWLFTSTRIGDISPMAAAIDSGVGDLRLGDEEPPFAIWRMNVDESARIFEIHSPNDWHRLCVEYPAEGNSGDNSGNEPGFSRYPDKLVPGLVEGSPRLGRRSPVLRRLPNLGAGQGRVRTWLDS